MHSKHIAEQFEFSFVSYHSTEFASNPTAESGPLRERASHNCVESPQEMKSKEQRPSTPMSAVDWMRLAAYLMQRCVSRKGRPRKSIEFVVPAVRHGTASASAPRAPIPTTSEVAEEQKRRVHVW